MLSLIFVGTRCAVSVYKQVLQLKIHIINGRGIKWQTRDIFSEY